MRRTLVAMLLPFALQAGAMQAASSPSTPLGADMATTLTRSAVITEQNAFISSPPLYRETSLPGLPAEYETSSAVVAAKTTTGALAFDETKMMHVADLRPGMKGYGLTVFKGIRPEKFEAEVVGVRHRVFPGGDMILCKLSSPYLKDIGVIAGMSGSPVYIDGKLIGAVGYGWGFTNEPLAGVTPIESMLQVFNSTYAEQPESESSGGSTFDSYRSFFEMRSTLTIRSPWKASGPDPLRINASDLDSSYRNAQHLPESITMQPLATPLFLSSASPTTLEIIQKAFAGLNVQPVAMAAGGSSSDTTSANSENSPGGKVTDLKALGEEMSDGYGLAIPLVEGDMSMAGVGTLSYRNGDRFVAFAHPMFEFGVVNYPMAPARINALVRSLDRPFKLGESLGQVGAVRQDRLPAIGGLFGQSAPMFQVRCQVEDKSYRGEREFNYRIWNDRNMGPMLAMSVLAESIAGAGRSGGDTVAIYKSSMSFDDGTTLSLEDYMADQSGGVDAAMTIGANLGVMMNNPYKKVRPKNVDFSIRIAERYPQAQIMAATLDRAYYRPGDTVNVTWDVQPYRKEIQKLNYSFRLPENIAEGRYDLSISDAGSRASIDRRRNPGGEQVFNYETLLNKLRKNFPRNKVYLTLQDSDTGVAVKGNELPKLPGSIIDTIQSTVEDPYFAPVRGNFLVDSEVATNYEVSGNQTLTLYVSKRPL